MLGLDSNFYYDRFLNYGTKDKAVVRETKEWLWAKGLQIWFDEWVFKPGDCITARIEERLERSRVLALCMSVQTFGSNCAQLESSAFRFRDPLNKERLFLALLDYAPIDQRLPGAR